MDPAKLKVVELRAELASRGLDTKGNKPVLVKRLREALEAETGNDLPDTSIADTSTEDINTSNVSLSQSSPPEPDVESKEPEREVTPEPVESPPKSRSRTRKSNESSEKLAKPKDRERKPEPEKMEESVPDEKPVKPTSAEPVPEPEPPQTKVEEKVPEKEPETEQTPEPEQISEPEKEPEQAKSEALEEKIESAPSPASAPAADGDQQMEVEEPEPEKEQEEQEDVEMVDSAVSNAGDSNLEPADAEKDAAEPRNRKSRWGSVTATEPTDSGGADSTPLPEPTDSSSAVSTDEPRGEKRRHGSPSPERVARKRSRSPVREDEPEQDEKNVQLSWIDSDLNLQVNKENFSVAEPIHSEGFGYMWAGVRSTHGVNSGKVCFEVKLLENCEWDDAIKEAKKEKKDKERNKEKRESTEGEKKESTEGEKKESTEEEKKDSTEGEKKDSTEGETKESTEVEQKEPAEGETNESIDGEQKESTEEEKIEEEQQPEADTKKEATPVEPTHVFRVGWSLSSSDLQLGEQPNSYAYDSEGFAVTDSKFTEFGVKYNAGDVVGAYLDMDSDSISISYTVNGELQSTAFTVPRSDFPEDAALFPHLLTKNIKFEVNFGQNEEPWYQHPADLPDYTFIQNVETKVDGLKRATERKECEVILMVGLPCSGKTHWVNNHVAQNPDKKYNVIGLGGVLDKMKYRGQSRKEHFKGSTTVLMDKCTRCVTKLVDIACARRRNFILDQTNLFSSAQRRKMRPFDGFRRQAVVIVVADDEQSSREQSRQQADGKDVPDSAVLEMKANMCLPTVCDWLDEVTYAELDESEAKEIVQKYNKQGREAGYGPNYTAKQHNSQKMKMNDRRNQWGRNNKRDSSRENRNNRWSGGGGGGGGHNRQNNWSGNRGSGGGWGRHDNRNHHHGGAGGSRGGDYRNSSNNRMMSGGSGGGGGGYNRNQGGSGGGYNRNRNQPPHRNQMQNKGGNWGGQGGGGGSWNSQGSWGNQGGWGGHQSGGQGGSSGAGWSQGSWGQYGNNQGGQGGGNQQWKGGYNAQQYQQQGYAQGYPAGQYGQGQYANWNYYGQYAQNWNAQGGQQGSTGGASDSTGNAAQYNQYTQQQQAAWAQYAQSGYGGYGQAAAGNGNNALTGSAASQQTSTTKQ